MLPRLEHRLLTLLNFLLLLGLTQSSNRQSILHTNQWLIKLNSASPTQQRNDEVEKLAKSLGFVALPRHQVLDENEFIFQNPLLDRIRPEPSLQHTHKLNQHPSIDYAIQLEGLTRQKRGYRSLSDDSLTRIELQPLSSSSSSASHSGWKAAAAELLSQADPLFTSEWYLYNSGQADGKPGLDLNVLGAWAQNVTGYGVTTAIMDDGIDYLHEDLWPNYAADLSYDFSSNDIYPYPRYTDDWFNSHGTRCAGEVSAVAGNGVCGVGVAPNSRVAGLRMLDQPYMTDLLEAAAISHANQEIDIYSASWGPTDDGKTLDGPRNKTILAMANGINHGRKGKGNLFVWASGDGGRFDDCNCDGYTVSMWTISINSVTNDGLTAIYDESCASTLASTFSNGKRVRTGTDLGVATSDLYNRCTTKHSGTSAAAPEAAGVFALALEANPDLTWRDVQHLTVLTSKRNQLYDKDKIHNWTINGAGLEFNHLFGYGILDAGHIVELAKQWMPLPERFHCSAGVFRGRKLIKSGSSVAMHITTDACEGDLEHKVNYIEHVQAYLSIKSSRRGDLSIFLTSPMNTTTMLLSNRPKDDDSERGFVKWPFMSTHTWGENPAGQWRLVVGLNDGRSAHHDSIEEGRDEEEWAILTEWILVVHGTQKAPYAGLPVDLNDMAPKLGIVKRKHNNPTFRN